MKSEMNDDSLFDKGMEIRRKVLGDEWVNQGAKSAATFGAGFQELVTTVGWGSVWSRPGLALRDRSLIVIALMAAQNRLTDLELHLHGGYRNGLSKLELEEALIQVGLYAGFPVASAANAIGKKVFAEIEAQEAASSQT